MMFLRRHWTVVVQCVLATLLLQRDAISIQDQNQPQQPLTPVASALSELPPCSVLRRQLEQGERGSGIDEPYMAAMLRASVKRAFFEVLLTWKKGQPADLRIVHRLFFAKFDGPDTEITNPEKLFELNQQGLTTLLDNVVMERVLKAPYFPGREGHSLHNGLRMYSYVELFSSPLLPEPRTLLFVLGKEQPLEHAAYIGDVLGVQQQLKRKRTQDQQVSYVLSQAVLNRYDNSAVIKLLVNAGADVNFHGHDGVTPLMNAVPHPCNLKALLELGARAQETDRWGKTALQLAQEEKQTESIRLLLAHSSQNN